MSENVDAEVLDKSYLSAFFYILNVSLLNLKDYFEMQYAFRFQDEIFRRNKLLKLDDEKILQEADQIAHILVNGMLSHSVSSASD